MSTPTNPSVISKIRKGTSDDPFLQYSNVTHQVVNGKVVLEELPDPFNHVTVTGNSMTWYEGAQGTVPSGNVYVVDYNNGTVSFDTTYNNINLQFSFYGRGLQYLDASRIYTQLDSNNNIAQTLQSIIGAGVGSWTYKGVYSNITSYLPNNVVTYNGIAYICIVNSIGNLPTNTTYWNIFVQPSSESFNTVSYWILN